jgi:hypothetical protein
LRKGGIPHCRDLHMYKSVLHHHVGNLAIPKRRQARMKIARQVLPGKLAHQDKSRQGRLKITHALNKNQTSTPTTPQPKGRNSLGDERNIEPRKWRHLT